MALRSRSAFALNLVALFVQYRRFAPWLGHATALAGACRVVGPIVRRFAGL